MKILCSVFNTHRWRGCKCKNCGVIRGGHSWSHIRGVCDTCGSKDYFEVVDLINQLRRVHKIPVISASDGMSVSRLVEVCRKGYDELTDALADTRQSLSSSERSAFNYIFQKLEEQMEYKEIPMGRRIRAT